MKLGTIFLLGILFSLYSCDFSPYRNYTRKTGGLYFNLIELGDGTKAVMEGNYITANIAYRTLEDSVFFKGVRKFLLEKAENDGQFNMALKMLAEGDSGSFILSSEDYFKHTLQTKIPVYLENNKFIKIDVRVLEVQTPREFEKEKNLFLSWVREFRMSEYDIIHMYLKDNQLNLSPEPNGIYFLSHTRGEGPEVRKGMQVTVHYEGKFLNGKFIDSTREMESPVDFIFGQEMFLIEGLEYAIGRMNEGSRAVVLIPSDLAFGSSGSYQGIIPPYSALIYEIEVLKVE